MNINSISTDSDEINVYATGDPSNTPIILVHGGAGGIWTWAEVVKHLDQYYCLMVELPEHGRSTLNRPFSIQRTAQLLIKFLHNHSLQGETHIIGLSVGGQVVLELLSREAQLFKSAIISGALYLPITGYRLGLYSEPVMTLIYYLGIRPWRNFDPWIKLNMKVASGIPDVFFPAFKKNFQEMTSSAWEHSMSEYYRYRLPDGLDQIHLPVLLIAGIHEKIDVRPTNRFLNRIIPKSYSVLVGGNNRYSAVEEHNWCMTMPELCAHTIMSWTKGNHLPELVLPDKFPEN